MAQANLQSQSLLFQLPQEIRDHIYHQLFASTRFSFGRCVTGGIADFTVKPAPNGLALLRACRRAQLEIGNSWLRHVLFCFEDAKSMLDKLSALPTRTLSMMRRMRISGDTLMLTLPDDPDDTKVFYRLVAVLKLLPGLRLDQLTVLGTIWHQVNYDTLDGLITDGNGWKTLRYISCSSVMLGYPSRHQLPFMRPSWTEKPQSWRQPQPKHWQTVLEGRDGAASGPSVTIYRAKEPGSCGSILDPAKRVGYKQKPRKNPHSRPDVFPADPELMTGDEQHKEIMVVVKRGSGVDYGERKSSPFISSDIRRDFPGRTWAQTRAAYIDHRLGEDEEAERDPIREDVYSHVDEYAFQPPRIIIVDP
ncbi:hypothetical protein C8A01DRAFT_45205 [Parachaetomium inaequale]|uniref:Uncharacterized protein n=1 Tax=Parachaetomium inaequale TaxID=2588326 RepID=A0AAN6PNC7_9PEZI|nr:hypothetical protein C8A01DRAFT_45205 [Parachaetomium inaequale]